MFSISIIPEDLESSRRALAFGSVNTRFRAVLKNTILGSDRLLCSSLVKSIDKKAPVGECSMNDKVDA